MKYMLRIVVLLVGTFIAAAAFAQHAEEHTTDVTQKLDPSSSTETAQLDLDAVEDSVRAAANTFRSNQNLGALTPDETLQQTAGDFAEYLASNDVLGHTADGRTPAQRAEAHGYAYCIVLENLAYVYRTSGFTHDELVTEFIEGWKDSPPHRENLVDPDVTQTGVGIARSGDTGTYYAVQLFGLPQSEQREVTIANESSVTVEYRLGERTLELGPRTIRTHTICRPKVLEFSFGDAQTYHPQDGARFVVRGTDGALSLEVASP